MRPQQAALSAVAKSLTSINDEEIDINSIKLHCMHRLKITQAQHNEYLDLVNFDFKSSLLKYNRPPVYRLLKLHVPYSLIVISLSSQNLFFW